MSFVFMLKLAEKRKNIIVPRKAFCILNVLFALLFVHAPRNLVNQFARSQALQNSGCIAPSSVRYGTYLTCCWLRVLQSNICLSVARLRFVTEGSYQAKTVTVVVKCSQQSRLMNDKLWTFRDTSSHLLSQFCRPNHNNTMCLAIIFKLVLKPGY